LAAGANLKNNAALSVRLYCPFYGNQPPNHGLASVVEIPDEIFFHPCLNPFRHDRSLTIARLKEFFLQAFLFLNFLGLNDK